MTRVYLHTFGCKANQYDTEVMRQALGRAGAVPVDRPEEADVAVVNSCTVTHVSEAKVRGFVRRLARGNESMRTVVTGCAAALNYGAIRNLPGVTDVVPGSDPAAVLRVLGLATGEIDPVLRSFTGGSRAWLKIQDGCDEHCTFCAATRARGDSRSRVPQQIVEEAGALSERHSEIVLTGVHIGAYGADLRGSPSLSSLVEKLIASIPSVRFRLSSLEATEVDERLEELFVGSPDRLAPHVHAPLQSGSDRVLRLMGRSWYSANDYRERVERLASRVGALGLGADVMVGFPGETDDDFRATQDLVATLPYTYLHVFQYSERAGTPAARFGPPVSPEVSRSRSGVLRALACVKSAAYRRAQQGRTADVVVLRRARGRFDGLTGDYLHVGVKTDRLPPPRFRARLKLADGVLWADEVVE